MGFMWVSYARGKVEAFDWLGGEKCAAGHKKTADLFGSVSGPSGAQMRSNERGKVPGFKS